MKRMADADLSLWRNQTPEAVYDEAQRARASETEKSLKNTRLVHDRAELVRQLEAKDATIEGLADALETTAPLFSATNGPCWGCHSPVPADDADHRDLCRARRAALRRAGRIR
jgi:hypothetical protein